LEVGAHKPPIVSEASKTQGLNPLSRTALAEAIPDGPAPNHNVSYYGFALGTYYGDCLSRHVEPVGVGLVDLRSSPNRGTKIT
jgi:hypothetical protein